MALQTFTAAQVLTAAQMNALQANDYNQTVSTKTTSYVLTAADKGTRVTMNAAGSTTITVNTSLFAAGDTVWIQNIGAGTCTITAGTATVTTASSLALAQWGGGTLYFTSASAAIFFSQQSASYGVATGGTSSSITVSGINYTLLTFTADGTLTVTKSGLFDCLLFGGGGASAAIENAGYGHGGGAGGGIMQATIYLDANQAVVVGVGAANADPYYTPKFGGVSSIGTGPTALSTIGGQMIMREGVGASSGVLGSQCGSIAGVSSAGSNNIQGYKGGNSGANGGGGGGGAGGAGGNASGNTGGAGGLGYDTNAFTGAGSLFKASGGGGGGSTAGGAAGSSLSNAGSTTNGNTPAANTAAGGGGGVATGTKSAGASGIVYIRFKV